MGVGVNVVNAKRRKPPQCARKCGFIALYPVQRPLNLYFSSIGQFPIIILLPGPHNAADEGSSTPKHHRICLVLALPGPLAYRYAYYNQPHIRLQNELVVPDELNMGPCTSTKCDSLYVIQGVLIYVPLPMFVVRRSPRLPTIGSITYLPAIAHFSDGGAARGHYQFFERRSVRWHEFNEASAYVCARPE